MTAGVMARTVAVTGASVPQAQAVAVVTGAVVLVRFVVRHSEVLSFSVALV
jgi:hypothetical protein